MSFEVTSWCAGELTLHASERPLSWMCQHVCLEVTSLCAFVFTMIAAERLFSGMNKNVLFHIWSVGERVWTHRASVGFFSSLLYLGFGCKRHCTTFSGKLAVSSDQLHLYLRSVSLVSELWADWGKSWRIFWKKVKANSNILKLDEKQNFQKSQKSHWQGEGKAQGKTKN